MKSVTLAEALKLAESWPVEAQEQLACYAADIEAGLRGSVYDPTSEEIEAIDRGLVSAKAGRFAADPDVEKVLGQFSQA